MRGLFLAISYLLNNESVPLESSEDGGNLAVGEPLALEIKKVAPKPAGAIGEAILIVPIIVSIRGTGCLPPIFFDNWPGREAELVNFYDRDAIIGFQVFYPTGEEYCSSTYNSPERLFKTCVSVRAYFDDSDYVAYRDRINPG